MKKVLLFCMVTLAGILLPAAAAVNTTPVRDVAGLTNALAQAGARVILLAKGVYDVSDCMGELCGGYANGRLSFATGKIVTLEGAPGTKRGDVVIMAPSNTDRYLIYAKKGTLTLKNLTLTRSSAGGIRFDNGDSHLRATDCVFSNLTAGVAAVVSRYYSNPSAQNDDVYRDCLFADNHATDGGGGCLNARGAVAYGCVFSNNTAKTNGGAVLAGSYVDCTFVGNSVTDSTTAGGGGAIGCDNDNNIGYCSGCVFEGNSLFGKGHGAAIDKAAALTNCVFRGNDAQVNSVIRSATDIVGCTFDGNDSTSKLIETADLVQRCVFSGNNVQAMLFDCSAVVANTLFVSNTCISAVGIVNCNLYNCTFIGNLGKLNRNIGYSIVSASSTAVNCLFYENMANCTTNLDMALRFAKSDWETPLSPFMTNCLWTVDMTNSDTHKAKALARTKDCQQMDASKYRFASSGEHPYALVGGAAASYAGYLDAEVRNAVGETDLAGNPRMDGDRITLGCYQRDIGGFIISFR